MELFCLGERQRKSNCFNVKFNISCLCIFILFCTGSTVPDIKFGTGSGKYLFCPDLGFLLSPVGNEEGEIVSFTRLLCKPNLAM